MKIKTTVLTLALALSGAAFAQAPTAADPTATPRIDKREANQEKRIEQGVASGQLTSREAARMERQQARVENAEAAAKADGNVTAKERKHIAHMQDKDSKRIYRQKHDAQRVKP
jgi:hypothetical protein